VGENEREDVSKLKITFRPSLVGELLGTGYSEFESSTGIHGLAKLDGDTLSLLAVHATTKRQGQFRTFISQAKRKFNQIEILEVWNLGLRRVLLRYGFNPVMSDEFVWAKTKGKT
jgi:GTP-sensing pleiotropic transcriptional regulator CodY